MNVLSQVPLQDAVHAGMSVSTHEDYLILDTVPMKGRFVEGYTCFYEKQTGTCSERMSKLESIRHHTQGA